MSNERVFIGATVVRVAGGRVRAAFGTLLVLAAVGNRGEKGVIVVVHHSGMFSLSPSFSLRFSSLSLCFPQEEIVRFCRYIIG